MRTKAEITAEIKELRAVMKHVPKLTLFGDDNHDRILAQIEVLEKGMSSEKCDTFLYRDSDEDGEPSEAAFDIESHARDAANWRDEEEHAEAPSKDWLELANTLKKKR